MSMGSIHGSRMVNDLSIDFVFLGSRTVVFSSGCCFLGIKLDSVDLTLCPHICKVESSLGDSDVQLWLKPIELD